MRTCISILILALLALPCSAQTTVNPLGPVGPAGSVQSLIVSPPTSAINPLNFGTVQTSTSSPTQNIAISSAGTIGVTISVTQTGSSDFVVTNLTGCNGLQPAGAVCILSLSFQPSAAVARTGSILIATDIPAHPLFTVFLSGTGSASATYPLTITATDNGFGTIKSGEATPKINCVIAPPAAPSGLCSTNYTNGTSVTLTATQLAGSTFQSFNGASCSVSPCTFNMASPGFTVVADFSANGAASQARASVTPTSILFGTQQNNVASPVQVIEISNTSPDVPLTVNSVLIFDSHFSSTAIHACDGTVPPLASCPLSLFFTPTSGIAYSGALTVNTNAAVDPNAPLTISLSGSGTATPTFPLSINALSTMTGSGTIASNEATPLINCHFAGNGAPGTGLCTGSYASGSTPILTATPDANQTFNTFSGTGCGTTSPSTVTVSAAITCTVSFTAPIPTVSAAFQGLGQGTGTVTSNVNDVVDGNPLNCTSTAGILTGKCTLIVNQGTAVTFAATASGGCTGGACTFTTWGGILGCSTTSPCGPTTINASLSFSATFAPPPAGAPLLPIQFNNGSNPGGGSVGAAYTSAQSAGDTNIIYGLWTGVGTVTSITDTKGNTYVQSTCSPQAAGGLTLVAYHANSILAAGAGANTVTIAITTTPSFLKIFISEYQGLTASPVDVCHGATGTGTAVSSGNLTSTVAGDLLTASALVANQLSAADPLWTRQIFPSNSNDMEDRQGVPIGTYANAPTQNTSGNWADIAEAWKVSGGSTPTSFTFSLTCDPAGNGSGTVTSGALSLTCTNGVPNAPATTSVAANSQQTVNATAQSGSAFVKYNGGNCGTQANCLTTQITTNTNVAVTFSLAGVQQYFVNSSTGSNGNNGLCIATNTPAGCTGGPWATIQGHDSAIVLGAGGTRINVANGAGYTGPTTTTKSGTATQRISYVSTTLYGAHITTANWLLSGSYTDVNGFDMTSTGAGGFCVGTNGGASAASVGSFEKVLNNYCHDVQTASCGFAAAMYDNGTQSPAIQSTDNQFLSNIIRHVGSNSCTTMHGIYADGPRDVMSNNVVSGVSGWAIQRIANGPGQTCGASTCFTGVISNNTLFNNGGGILLNESNNAGFQATVDYHTISNNVIVNNGVAGAGTPAFGLNWYHVTGTHNLATNNLMYGNLPADQAHHGFACGTSASGSTPVAGIPISPSNDQTAAGGCPAASSQTDSGGTAATFVNFRADTNASPDGSYNVQNYVLKSTSHGVNTGSTLCAASPGINPCVPGADFNGVNRPAGLAYDIGAFEQ